jgi:hypothetical protein
MREGCSSNPEPHATAEPETFARLPTLNEPANSEELADRLPRRKHFNVSILLTAHVFRKLMTIEQSYA